MKIDGTLFQQPTSTPNYDLKQEHKNQRKIKTLIETYIKLQFR